MDKVKLMAAGLAVSLDHLVYVANGANMSVIQPQRAIAHF